jgi:pimeloyl-ACP methyl ester carboxylesterase
VLRFIEIWGFNSVMHVNMTHAAKNQCVTGVTAHSLFRWDFVTGGSLDYIDYRQVRLSCTPGWEVANYEAGPPNVWKGLSSIRVPVTIILAETRSTCPEESVQLLQKKLPSARIVRVPGSSHFLPMEQPDAVRLEMRLMARQLDGNARHH